MKKKCKVCAKYFIPTNGNVRKGYGIFCNKICHGMWLSKHNKGKNNNNWKGNKIGYNRIHGWLRNTFGKANRCESLICTHRSNNYHWALIKGKQYQRKRENFKPLCVSCHRIYDGAKANSGSFKKGQTPWNKKLNPVIHN